MTLGWLLLEGNIKVPRLEELAYSEYGLKGGDEECTRFFSTHQSIKKVHIRVGETSTYAKRLYLVPNIDELVIQGTSTCQWISPFFTPMVDEGLPVYVCPNLRILTIMTWEVLPLHLFEELVRVRCLPIDEKGNTAAGCRAVKVLRLQKTGFRNIYSSLSKSEVWKQANVWEISDGRYELQWPYQPK
jgi:hypothetical protein